MLFSKETMLSYAHSKGIKEIEDDCLKFMSQELEFRIKELCQWATKNMTYMRRTKLSVDDINYALVSRNIEPLFGYDPHDSLVFKSLPPNIFYVPDKEIDLDDLLNKALPRMKQSVTIQSHWLAIEGVQPQTPENPLITERVEQNKEVLSILAEESEIKQQNKHILSKELQLYFDKVLSLIKSDSKRIAIDCLSNESGIQQLIPYFIQNFNEFVIKNLKDPEVLSTYISLYDGLIKNSHIFIDPYLHQMIPSLLTCVIGKNITSDQVRIEASELIKYIYNRFSKNYKTLAPRILKTLSGVWLDKSKSEDSQYGALFCLCILSSSVVETVVKTNRKAYEKDIGNKKVMDVLEKVLGHDQENN